MSLSRYVIEPDTGPKALGSCLREARKRAGLSQVQFAELAGVGQAMVSDYECGRRSPSVALFVRWLGLLGCEVTISQKIGIGG